MAIYHSMIIVNVSVCFCDTFLIYSGPSIYFE